MTQMVPGSVLTRRNDSPFKNVFHQRAPIFFFGFFVVLEGLSQPCNPQVCSFNHTYTATIAKSLCTKEPELKRGGSLVLTFLGPDALVLPSLNLARTAGD